MSQKTIIWIFVFIGSLIGGYLPLLWGDSAFSFASVLFGGIGGIAGVWVGIKVGRMLL